MKIFDVMFSILLLFTVSYVKDYPNILFLNDFELRSSVAKILKWENIWIALKYYIFRQH
jgi:hypothetical protein